MEREQRGGQWEDYLGKMRTMAQLVLTQCIKNYCMTSNFFSSAYAL